MSSTFFMPSTDPTPYTPAVASSWGVSAGVTRSRWSTARMNSAMTSFAAAETSAVAVDVAVRQFISDIMTAQTISGNVHGVIRAIESAADADMAAQVVLRVLSEDCTVERAVLLAADTSALSNEFDATTLTNRFFPRATASPGPALTSYTCVTGDRLVMEVGTRAFNTIAASRTATLRFGDATSTLLVDNETGTADNTPWMLFTHTFDFLADQNMGAEFAPGVDETPLDAEAAPDLNMAPWPTISLNQGVSQGTTEYIWMRAVDPDCAGYPGTPTYRFWPVTGVPDETGAQYTGTRCGVNPLVNITTAFRYPRRR